MDFKEFVFIGEIVLQIKIAQRAADRLTTVGGPYDPIEVLSLIQLILMAAANVSKILWPPYKKYKARGEYLRKLLVVNEGNILSDRTLRNHFEHYDERIDEWFANCPSKVYMDLEIGPIKSPFGNEPRLFINKHRWYDPSTKILLFRGEPINLAEVLNELEKIKSQCSKFVPI